MKKKKIAETINHNTESESVTKSCHPPIATIKVLEEYFDHYVQQDKPLTQTGLMKLCEEMVKEVEANEQITSITMYCRLKGVSRRTWSYWVTKYPEAARANDLCMEIIADRNQRKVHDDFRYIHIVQPIYDDLIYLKGLKLHSDLKKVENDADEKLKVIYIEKTESTGLVPKRKAQDDTVADEIL